MDAGTSDGELETISLRPGESFRIDRYIGFQKTVQIAVESGAVRFYGIAPRERSIQPGCGGRCIIYVETGQIGATSGGDPDRTSASRVPVTPLGTLLDLPPVIVDVELEPGGWIAYSGGLSVSICPLRDGPAIIHRILRDELPVGQSGAAE
jgi:hypothetical protein